MKQKHSLNQFALKFLFLLSSTFALSVSQAEYFGTLNGRTADFSKLPQMSVEASLSSGNFQTADYQQIGVRLNYQYSPEILLFGDLGQSELNAENETSYGIGGYYSLDQSILWSDDSAIKLSLHQVNFERIPGITDSLFCPAPLLFPDPILGAVLVPQPCTVTPGTRARGGDVRNFALELLISGDLSDSMFGDAANWYANGGIQMFNGDIIDDTVLTIGGGIVYPFGQSEFYTGFEYADEAYLGIGFRYFVQ